VTAFEVTYGHKIGWLKFVTNKDNVIENGHAKHATVYKAITVSSVKITRHENHIPPRCKGIILGFRPFTTDPN